MVRQLTIIAELKDWHLDDENNNITGTIHNSKDKWYPDGERFHFLSIRGMSHYTEDNEEYWLVMTQIGNYFKCYRRDMR